MLGFIFQQYNLLPRLNLLETWRCRWSTPTSPAPSATSWPGMCWKRWVWATSSRTCPTSFPAAAAARFHRTGSGAQPGGHPCRRTHRCSGLPHRPRGHRDASAAPQRGPYRGAHHPRQFHRRAGGAYHRLEDGQVVYDGDAHAPRPSCSPLCPAKRHRRKQNNGIRDFPPGTAERLEQ